MTDENDVATLAPDEQPTGPEPTALTSAEATEAELPAEEEAVEVEARAEVGEGMPPRSDKHWYVVKVQSGREESIKEAIERRVKLEGLEDYVGQIIIPVEKVSEVKNNKRKIKERKLFPGYLMAEVEFNDRVLYLFRETSGVGDFVGGSLNRPPVPMSPREVEKMLGSQSPEKAGQKIVEEKPKFEKGDRVRVKDGTFAGMEGEVAELLEAKSQVRIQLTIFGRPVPVELEYWQVEPV